MKRSSATTSEGATARAEPASAEPSRLFVVCGRGRKVDELRALFAACGAIKHLHLALDRSNKSRGFAFLQYEDPANAALAIAKFDQMKLADGHILKVTVAKERPNGKLKRNQLARHDADDKADGGTGNETESVPGKRQRSSPPVHIVTAPAAPFISLDAALTNGTDSFQVPAKRREIYVAKREVYERSVKDEGRDWVREVVSDMVLVLEESAYLHTGPDQLMRSYLELQDRRRLPASSQPIEVKMEEAATDMITSSIGSVSLAGTSGPQSPLAARATLSTSVAFNSSLPRAGKSMLRRRRQSTDDSDSSGEDGHDSGGNRRKRSNTTVTSPPAPRAASARAAAFAGESLDDPTTRHNITRVNLPANESALLSRKLCKRHSSDSARNESTRSVKQQATSTWRGRNASDHNSLGDTMDHTVDALSTAFDSLARTRLFFISTHKFTAQELEAMFAVYGDFESVQIVKSFGRVKTMAYIKYSQASTAARVVQAFQDEVSAGDDNPESDEFMKLSFADSAGTPSDSSYRHPSSVSIGVRPSLGEGGFVKTEQMTTEEQDRRWLLLLFDRLLPNHVLSSTVTSCPGMEFIDIKMTKSTGESQGVAFVKFTTERYTVDASRELHQLELPRGSGKHLQALVIADPSQFSTAHNSNPWQASSDVAGVRTSGDDVDIGAVEARFAHMMRSTDHYHLSTESFPFQSDQFVDYNFGGDGSDGFSTATPYPGSFVGAAQVPQYGNIFAASSPGIAFFPMPIPAVPTTPPYQSMPPAIHHAPLYNQVFGTGSWMNPAPSYFPPHPASSQYQYPFAPAQRTDNTLHAPFPVQMERNEDRSKESAANGASVHGEEKPRLHSLSSAESDGSAGSTAKSADASIHVSSSRPVDIVMIVTVLQDCSGMMAFRKDGHSANGSSSFIVQFATEVQALSAIEKLDGSICQGVKLRAQFQSTAQSRNFKGKSGANTSGRRKRQRVDARSKSRSES